MRFETGLFISVRICQKFPVFIVPSSTLLLFIWGIHRSKEGVPRQNFGAFVYIRARVLRRSEDTWIVRGIIASFADFILRAA